MEPARPSPMVAANRMYERVIEADPTNADNLGDYARFLEKIRRDYDRAETMYLRKAEQTSRNRPMMLRTAPMTTRI